MKNFILIICPINLDIEIQTNKVFEIIRSYLGDRLVEGLDETYPFVHLKCELEEYDKREVTKLINQAKLIFFSGEGDLPTTFNYG